MRRIILQQFVTVDGFAAETHGGMSFQQDYVAKNDTSFQEDGLRFLDTIDTMILGANTYHMFVQYWPYAMDEVGEFAQKLNAFSKYVVSTTLESAPWGDWEDAKLIKDNIYEEINQLKQEEGKDIVLWGSLQLAESLGQEGLIDEYQLRVCPSAIGDGKGTFPHGLGIQRLELVEAKPYDKGMVLLRYIPEK